MGSTELEQLAVEIFKTEPKIVHLGLIGLDGNVILDQSSAATEPSKPDPDRVEFYSQLDVRRHGREHFDEVYGKTEYIHIIRENMQQMILYLPMITVYATLEKSITPEEVKSAALKIKFIDDEFITNAIKS